MVFRVRRAMIPRKSLCICIDDRSSELKKDHQVGRWLNLWLDGEVSSGIQFSFHTLRFPSVLFGLLSSLIPFHDHLLNSSHPLRSPTKQRRYPVIAFTTRQSTAHPNSSERRGLMTITIQIHLLRMKELFTNLWHKVSSFEPIHV